MGGFLTVVTVSRRADPHQRHPEQLESSSKPSGSLASGTSRESSGKRPPMGRKQGTGASQDGKGDSARGSGWPLDTTQAGWAPRSLKAERTAPDTNQSPQERGAQVCIQGHRHCLLKKENQFSGGTDRIRSLYSRSLGRCGTREEITAEPGTTPGRGAPRAGQSKRCTTRLPKNVTTKRPLLTQGQHKQSINTCFLCCTRRTLCSHSEENITKETAKKRRHTYRLCRICVNGSSTGAAQVRPVCPRGNTLDTRARAKLNRTPAHTHSSSPPHSSHRRTSNSTKQKLN